MPYVTNSISFQVKNTFGAGANDQEMIEKQENINQKI
jgi:hypothetical protein